MPAAVCTLLKKNDSSMKLEMLAMKWAMAEKFREYLWGHRCVVWIDNNPLSHLDSAKLGATEHRWIAELSAFEYIVRYRLGRVKKNADALSRQRASGDRTQLERHLPGTVIPEEIGEVFVGAFLSSWRLLLFRSAVGKI